MRQPIFYVTTLLLALSLTAQAQSALDLGSQAALRRLRSNMPVTATLPDGTRHLAPARTTDVTPVMMIVEDGVTNEQLEAEGLIVSARRGNFVFASVAIDDVERIAGLRMIRKMQLPRDVQQKTDRARAAVGVDKIHAGEGLPKAYTGKNVVTGIVDGGIDPNNISFDREDGTSRVEYLTHIYSSNTSAAGYEMKEYNRETVRKFTTDDVTALHGTHTLNIMAGGYRGNVTMADQSSLIAGDIIEAPNPYYGMAPNSDIVASCGTLQDFFIAMGIESTLQYASYMGWPAVINLSLGSTTGPHDGTTVLSQYMKTVSDYAIICVSAGNEGDLPIALNKTLKDNGNTVQSFIQPLSESVQTSNGTFKNLRYGQIYIYSNDSTPFDVKAVIYNTDRDLITFQQASVSASQAGNAVYYISSEEFRQSETDKLHNNMTVFNGYLGVGAQLDPYSKRYYAIVDYYLYDNTAKNKGQYIPGFIVTGKDGQRIDCFCDGTWTVMNGYGKEGWLDGSRNGSISDMACGDGIIAVGAYNTRLSYNSLDGKSYNYPAPTFMDGDVSSFSSYGTTITGKNLPHVVAPGTTVISAISEPYTTNSDFGSYTAYQQAKTTVGKKTYYWQQQIGTSMASPVVAGAIALWLEADPNLTTEEALDIIAQTATRDEAVQNSTADPVQWGAGKFNAYAGLKEVIRRTAIDGTQTDPRLLVRQEGNRIFNIFLGGATSLDTRLFDISGRELIASSTTGDETTIDASALTAGVYILRVNNHTQKLTIQ